MPPPEPTHPPTQPPNHALTLHERSGDDARGGGCVVGVECAGDELGQLGADVVGDLLHTRLLHRAQGLDDGLQGGGAGGEREGRGAAGEAERWVLWLVLW